MKHKHILVLIPCSAAQRQRILQQTAYKVTFAQRGEAQFEAALSQAHIIFGEPTIEELQRAQNIQWVQMTWAGTDIYTAQDGFPKQAVLTNASGAFGTVISEYIIGAVLALYRNFPSYLRQQKQAVWRDVGSERTLYGKRVLILGVGDIGTNTAQRLRPFGVYLVGMRRVSRAQDACFDEIICTDQLEQQLSQADIVIGCLPNTPQTAGLLNKKRLLMMKPDAVLVNVGRGSLIPLNDVTEVLQSGHLSGAALDVLETEPLPKDHPLWHMDNVIVTPHIAGPSLGHAPHTEQLIHNIFLENLQRFSAGKPLRSQVDFDTGYRAAE